MPSTRSATTQQMTEAKRAQCIDLVLMQCSAPHGFVLRLIAGLGNRAVRDQCKHILREHIAIVAADAWKAHLWSPVHPDLQRGATAILQHDLPVVEWLGRSMLHHLKTRNAFHVGHDMCCPFHVNSGWLRAWLDFLAQWEPELVVRSLAENLFVRTGRLVENPEEEEPHMLTVVQKTMPSKIDAPDRPLEELARLKSQRPQNGNGKIIYNCGIASHRFDTVTLSDRTSQHVGQFGGLADEQVFRWADFWVKVDLMAMLAQLEHLQTTEIDNFRRCLLRAAHLAVSAVLGLRKLVERGMMPDDDYVKQLADAEEWAQERLQLLDGKDHAHVQSRCIQETQKVLDKMSAGVIDLEMPIGNGSPDGKGPPPVGMVKLKHDHVINMFRHYNNDGENGYSKFRDDYGPPGRPDFPRPSFTPVDVLYNLANLDNRPIACTHGSGGLQGVMSEKLRYILDPKFMPRPYKPLERAARNWYKYVDKMLIDGFCEATEDFERTFDEAFHHLASDGAEKRVRELRRRLVDLLQKASEDYALELVCEVSLWDLGGHLDTDEPKKVVRVLYDHDKISERIRNSDCEEAADTGHIGSCRTIDERTRRLQNALNLLGEMSNRYNFMAFHALGLTVDSIYWIHPHNASHGRIRQDMFGVNPTKLECQNIMTLALLGRIKLFTLPDMNAERSTWYTEPEGVEQPVYTSEHDDIKASGSVWYCTKWHGGVSLTLNNPAIFVRIAAYMYGNGGMVSWLLEHADESVLNSAKEEQASIMNLYKKIDIELKPFDLEATIAMNTMPQDQCAELYFAAASTDSARTLVEVMNGKGRLCDPMEELTF